MANDNLPLPTTPSAKGELSTTQPAAAERNGDSTATEADKKPGWVEAVSLLPLLKALGLYAVIFLGALLLGTGLFYWLGYRLQSAAAMAAILAGLFVMVVRMFLPQPFSKNQPQTAPQQPPTDSGREVIETVVFVVVLVLLLKSFVAEAFVIPTGSMAETLYGYQKVVTCPKCAYVFPVNVSQEVDPSDGTPAPVTSCTCPNCRFPINFGLYPPPGWGSGDRVLVGKYFYELVDQPERLEVVVFKYPGDEHFPHSGPHKYYVPLNYIKRLIGKPGETIGIYQGKIYVLSPELSPHYDDWEKAEHDPDLVARLWQRTPYQHTDDPNAVALFKQQKFMKLRKPPDTILSMSRIVYDNDHPASDLPGVQRWEGTQGSAWRADGGHGFANPGGTGASDWLHYHHLLRDAPSPSLITDFSGYNTFITPNHNGFQQQNWVADLLLECDMTIDTAEGAFVMELSKGEDRFQARWDLTTGDCDLIQINSGRENKLGSVKTSVAVKGRTYRLRFADVDDKLTVWVDDTLPFGDDGVPYESKLTLHPTEENDLQRPASIGVRGGAVKVRKLKLSRDTYYTNKVSPNEGPDYPGVRFDRPDTWGDYGRLDDMKLKTIYVQPHHYLCLGDNSPESSDGRSWGCVPERLLLGRAMLVYYPLGRAGKIR